jgi:hypothetical protein
MIGLALKLTIAGIGDHWEDVDRWVRNQFVENQMTHEKAQTLLENLCAKQLFEEQPVQSWQTDDLERCVGGFAGSASPNDFGLFMQHGCCTGNAARTLYWIWDSIVTKDDNRIAVNLLMNRASPWVDVDSYLPYQGMVMLKVKEAQGITVRIPDWVDCENVTCWVNGKAQECVWMGNYIQVGDLQPDDSILIEFPMKEKTFFSVIGDLTYKLTIKGNTVIDIDPEGEVCPLYQRDHYREDEAPTQKITRFVSSERILW